MITYRNKQIAATMDSQYGESTFKVQDFYNRNFSRPYKLAYIRQGADGKTMPSLVDLEQFPQQISSECHYNVEPSAVGPHVTESFCSPASGYSDLIRHREHAQSSQILNQTGAQSLSGNIILEPNNFLCNMDFDNSIYNHELVSQCRLEALQSKQSNFQPCPPASFMPSTPPMNGFTVDPKNIHNPVSAQSWLKPSRLSSLGYNNFQQQAFCNFQPPKHADLNRNLHHILLAYIKCRLADANTSRQEFLNRLHVIQCKEVTCKCENYDLLLSHYDKCQNAHCNICGPLRQLFRAERMMMGFGYRKELNLGGMHSSRQCIIESQPCAKRMKMVDDVQHDDWSLDAIVSHQLKFVGGVADGEDDTTKMNKRPSFECHEKSAKLNEEIPSFINNLGMTQHGDCCFDDERRGNGDAMSHVEEIWSVDEHKEMEFLDSCEVNSDVQSFSLDGVSVLSDELLMDEAGNAKSISKAEHVKGEADDLTKCDCQSCVMLENLKVSGVSLLDFFSPEQIKEHLHSLNQYTDLEGRNGESSVRTVDENVCQLCDMGVRMFAPPPMYCTYCGSRIKYGSSYYKPPATEANAKYSLCTSCFKQCRGRNISIKGLSYSKAKLDKCKNTDEIPEGWVQCDKCHAWQHQICALYNSKQDLGGKLDYICPFCRLFDLEAIGSASMPSAFGAKDLPRTKLSDHMEQRLFRSLEKERKQRAELLGKPPEEVPGAEDLVVRVVFAANKQLKVKQQFLDILHGETYPTEFPYKSKVLMLFQKVEGVDVCLFAMYLQEFGSECGHPNKRSVYISYLDSIKYFRPDIKTGGGVALRTFVYHEILIGYLDYCKQRGFITCYIWACPPSRGEDYILYCHPETQRTPNPQKLLQWYKKLLKKAKEEKVVVEYTNFYDHFFVPSGECNSKTTAARLPYFDGDYWSCAIEDMILTIQKEGEEGLANKLKFHTTKRALRALGHSDLSVEKTQNFLVMQKLGQTILPLKEDFFVVHLQFTCTNCNEPILCGSRWSCNQCSKYHLCGRCFGLEKNSSTPHIHTTTHGETHKLFQILVTDVASDTEDDDVLFDNDFLDDRLSFLKFCQENHYQFDTIRCAKHSSMMILHHLKTANARASVQTPDTCSFCQYGQIVAAQGLCEICSELSAAMGLSFVEAFGELT